jgi:hypothetical protein
MSVQSSAATSSKPFRSRRSVMIKVSACVAVFAVAVAPLRGDSPLGPSIGVHVEHSPVTVGLDDKTRTLLEKLPADVRKEFELLLQNALQRIDVSVHSYLTEVDRIALGILDRVPCVAAAVTDSVVDQLVARVTGRDVNPAQDLTRRWDKFGGQISRRSRATADSPHLRR